MACFHMSKCDVFSFQFSFMLLLSRLTLETPTSSQAIKLAKKLNESPVMKVELRDGTSQNFFVNKLFPRF